MTETPLLLAIPLLPVLWWMAWSDLSRMTIPNLAVLSAFGIFLVLGPFAFTSGEWLSRLAAMPVMLALGFVLSLAGVMGAGDAKAIAALAPFVARSDMPRVLILFALALVLGLVLHRLVRISPARRMVPGWRSWTDAMVPAGLSIATTLVVYILLPFGQE